ncbi:MAG: hypothetical protein J7647_24835 [Cyanobacteria bacterium SBLK]|nr:hypothetical protein [Cyanobacteria bacterium SBLK]
MNLDAIDRKVLIFIKVLSTVLIAGAIALDSWIVARAFPFSELPHFFFLLFWFTVFALGSHLIEGIIGTVVAFRRKENAIAAGIYIFFTGTVGLLEVLKLDVSS